MQREHGTLAGTSDKHQEKSRGNNPGSSCQVGSQLGHIVQIVAESSYIVTIEEDTYQEKQVCETCHDERFLGCMHGSVLGIVETYQQVGANAHELPEEIHLENIGSHHQTQHRHGEETQESVETLETLLVTFLMIMLVTLSHVTERVDMHHETHGGNHDKHHHADRRKAESYVECQQFGKP